VDDVRVDDAGPRRGACAVLVRTWKPARPEMTGPAARPMARPKAMDFAAAHFAAAVSRMVAVWLLMPSSSGAGGKKMTRPHDGGAAFYLSRILAAELQFRYGGENEPLHRCAPNNLERSSASGWTTLRADPSVRCPRSRLARRALDGEGLRRPL
jgi:hypothetical protein